LLAQTSETRPRLFSEELAKLFFVARDRHDV
jgi:hypothetical protein